MEKSEKEQESSRPISFKNFKSSSEMEVFYRFVHDNNLRDEAKILLKTVYDFHYGKKKRGSRKEKILQ